LFFKIEDPSAIITYVKIQKVSDESVETKASLAEETSVEQDRTLSVKGFTETGEILFQYNHYS
jgi:hypothetical protein